MSDDPTPTDPTQRLERGTMTGIALGLSIAANAIPVVKASAGAGAQVYDLLHPPKPDPSPIVLPPGVKPED